MSRGFWISGKKAPAVAGAFFVFFREFLREILESARFLGGVFAVTVWWIRGELWRLNDTPLWRRKTRQLSGYFLYVFFGSLIIAYKQCIVFCMVDYAL